MVVVQRSIDKVREEAETYDEYETRLAVISQQRLLILEDIEQEWIARCQTPQMATKELKDIKTLDQALDTLAPSLYKVKRIKGKKFAFAHIRMWIVYLQGMLNVKNKLSEAMIDDAAETILSNYGHLTLADIKNVFTDAKNGVYGEFYESLSIHKLTTWFFDYSEKRMAECAARNFSEHSYTKNDSLGWKDRRRGQTLSASDMLEIDRAMNEENE